MASPVIKTIGEVTALIPEASTADESHELLDGQSGDTDFPYARFKALATVGEVDPVTNKALTGWPDGSAAWLKDDVTVRVAYQSESYATMSNETYGPPPSGKLSPVLLTTRGLEEMTSASLQRGFQS